MFVEIYNDHPMYYDFINYVKEHVPEVEIRKYKVSTYISTKEVRLINFFSCVNHDATMTHKNSEGELISFPISLFGTIYEM